MCHIQLGAEATGIQNRLLDFFEEPQESLKTVVERLLKSLTAHGLKTENMVAYGADNTNTNYRENCSVFQKLKEYKSKLVKGNHFCHVIHNWRINSPVECDNIVTELHTTTHTSDNESGEASIYNSLHLQRTELRILLTFFRFLSGISYTLRFFMNILDDYYKLACIIF